MSLKIVAATRADAPKILTLIRALAQFERLAHECHITAPALRRALFGPAPVAAVLLAKIDGETVGYALYFYTFSTFVGRSGIWLEDLFVLPEFRNRGVGRALIEAVANVAKKKNCGRFEWSALNWNENALRFYRGLGAKTLKDWIILRVDARGLRRFGKREK